MKYPTHPKRRAALALAAVAVLALSLTSQAQAQSAYPNKPIRMIVPLAPGSAVDVAARLLAQKMSVNMGQTVIVENIVGAAGVIGASQVAKAAPDGYTLGGFNDSLLTMVPHLNPKTPFNPLTDFSHITQVATIEFSISVATKHPTTPPPTWSLPPRPHPARSPTPRVATAARSTWAGRCLRPTRVSTCGTCLTAAPARLHKTWRVSRWTSPSRASPPWPRWPRVAS